MSFCDKILEKMKNIKFLQQERGSILILTALLLPIMFGCLGIAYDVGNIYIHKARLQNVTDAAALAGGRAYLESQKKTETETVKKDTYDSYANGQVTDEEYVIGGSKTRSGYHPDADKAADDYIYKNIINLGEKVYSDKYSHYALPGLKKVGEDYINDSKIFYRIGLYEKVPLYFLSVLTNKNVETVRAGSVVVIEPGTTTTTIIPGSGGMPTGYTLFDKLFVVDTKVVANRNIVLPQNTDALSTKPVDQDGKTGAKIITTFDGEIVYAGSAWNAANAAGEVQDAQMGGYLYTKEEQGYQLAENLSIKEMNAIPNIGVKSVWDNTISIDSYVSGFVKKLERPHVEVLQSDGNDVQDFTTSSLITSVPSQFIQKTWYYVNTTSGKIYFHVNGNTFYNCVASYVNISGNSYYKLQNGELINYQYADTNWQTIPISSCVTASNGDTVYVYNNGSSLLFYKRIDNWPYLSSIQMSSVSSTDNEDTFSDGGSLTVVLEKITADFSQKVQVPDNEVIASSVYHWSRGQSVNLKIDGGLDGDESDPVYIILEKGTPIKIDVTQSNQRPVIFINLTTEEINDFGIANGVTFKGLVYSPYAAVNNIHAGTGASGGSFIGNIIGKEINIQNGGASWTQKNFVVNDGDLNTVSDAVIAAQEARKQQAISLAKTYMSSLVSDAAWNDASWFASQTAEKQQQIATAWYNARQQMWNDYGLDMPDWPWSTGGKTTDTDKHHYSTNTNTGGSTGEQVITTTTDETLRLINYRTEFQMRDDLANDDVLDPFIFETLNKPNSY